MNTTIQLIERRLQQLRSMIPLYKGKPPLENWLASKIIDWQIRRNEYFKNHLTPVKEQLFIPTLYKFNAFLNYQCQHHFKIHLQIRIQCQVILPYALERPLIFAPTGSPIYHSAHLPVSLDKFVTCLYRMLCQISIRHSVEPGSTVVITFRNSSAISVAPSKYG